MKKAYNTPTVDKIAFNYRDQVVVASGLDAGGSSDTNVPSDNSSNPSTLEQILNGIYNVVTDRSSWVDWC